MFLRNVKSVIAFRLNNAKQFIINMYYATIHNRQYSSVFCCYVDLSKLDRSITLNHPYAITIGKPDDIGKNCIIRQCVTIGAKYRECPEYPIIKNNVIINAGACVLGNVVIGNNCNIGANSTILKDVPDNMTIVGVWK